MSPETGVIQEILSILIREVSISKTVFREAKNFLLKLS
jgi:hypothetical protein